jgi:uncharacterized membrane protein YkvA (DUF1232 family)
MAAYNSSPSGNDVAGSALFKKFLASAESYLKQPTRLKKLLTDAYEKASEKKELGTLAHEAWTTLQSLFRLIKLSASGEYTELPATTVVAAIAVLLYFLSPIDLIPDFIPVLGLLDDMALVAWFSTTIKHELDKFHEWELAKAATVVSDHELWKNRLPETSTTNRSAKSTGTHATPTAPAGTHQSATDAGLGSPSSSASTPVHDQGADIDKDRDRTIDALGNTTDGSRDGNSGQTETGGNVR